MYYLVAQKPYDDKGTLCFWVGYFITKPITIKWVKDTTGLARLKLAPFKTPTKTGPCKTLNPNP